MRIVIRSLGEERIELVDRFEPNVVGHAAFPHPDDAAVFLLAHRSDDSLIDTLRLMLVDSPVVFDLSRHSDEQIVDEICRLLSTGELMILREEVVQAVVPEVTEKPEAAPAATKRAPAAAEPVPVTQVCTNPACNPAFKEAAESGAALVEASAPG